MAVVLTMEEARNQIPEEGSCVGVGVFDGVHLGHQEILRRVVSVARERRLLSVALTFEPHPLKVVRGGAPPLLTTLSERVHLIAGLGIDAIVIVEFSSSMADLEPEAFSRGILVEALKARHVVVGFNFTFGRKARGGPRELEECGRLMGFGVEALKPVLLSGRPVGSTEIRRLLREGKVKGARAMLGRPYSLTGTVVRGEMRGRALGYPTANILTDEELILPSDGVYAVRLILGKATYPGVLNIGVKPTFGAKARTVEVYLLDFQGELYGERVRVDFIERLRGERRFPDASALRRQIGEDVSLARSILAPADFGETASYSCSPAGPQACIPRGGRE